MRHRQTPCSRLGVCGQSTIEYALVTAILAVVLGLGMVGEDSVLKQLVDAFSTAYSNFSFAVALPG